MRWSIFVALVAILIFVLGKGNYEWLTFRKDHVPLQNWDQKWQLMSANTQEVVYVESVDDIVMAISRAREDGAAVKVVGSGHSWSSIAVPSPHHPHIILSLYPGMKDVAVVKEDGEILVRAQGGVTMKELADYMATHGLTIPSLPSTLDQTLAGALQTATHGCSARWSHLGQFVVAATVVDGEGRVHYVRAGDTCFHHGAVVGAGALGVLAEVLLKPSPLRDVRQVEQVVPVSEDLEAELKVWLTHGVIEDEWWKLWLWPHARRAVEFRMNAADVDASSAKSQGKREPLSASTTTPLADLFDTYIGVHIVRLLNHISGTMLPTEWIVPFQKAWVSTFFPVGRSATRVGSPVQLLPIPHLIPKHNEMELAIPIHRETDGTFRSNTLSCIAGALKAFDRDDSSTPMNSIFELRMTAADRAGHVISQSYVPGDTKDEDTVDGRGDDADVFLHISVLVAIPNRTRTLEYFDRFHSLLTSPENGCPRSIIPHWAKETATSNAKPKIVNPESTQPIARSNPLPDLRPREWGEFVRCRERFDPHRVFENEWLREWLAET